VNEQSVRPEALGDVRPKQMLQDYPDSSGVLTSVPTPLDSEVISKGARSLCRDAK